MPQNWWLYRRMQGGERCGQQQGFRQDNRASVTSWLDGQRRCTAAADFGTLLVQLWAMRPLRRCHATNSQTRVKRLNHKDLHRECPVNAGWRNATLGRLRAWL